MHEHGAKLLLTYQNDKLKPRVEKFAEEFGNAACFPCDCSSDEQIADLAEHVKNSAGSIDGLVHSIAYAPREALEGSFVTNTSRDNFNIAHEISSYSFTAVTNAVLSLLNPGSSIMTMTYYGAEKVIPNYNVMGLAKASLEANVRYMAANLGEKGFRVNGISAGPIRTLAASGIKDFRTMLDHNAKIAPMKANVTIEQVGNVAVFLASELSSAVTGEIMHVDNGFNIIGSAF